MRVRKIVDTTISVAFYALFALTPLIFNPIRLLPSFELFEWNKIILVYALTIVISCATLIKMLLLRSFHIPKTPFTIPLLLFWLSQAITTLFSIDPHVSIFGYYSRYHGGLLSISAYTLLFFAFIANRHILKPNRIIFVSLITAVIVALYGIAEKFGIDASMWVQDVQNRVFSTLGQPNWLAAFLTIFLPLSISKIVTIRNDRIGTNKNHLRNYFSLYSIVAILLYIALLFTKSRSGFLGFWAGFAVFGGLLWLWEKSKKPVMYTLVFHGFIFLAINFFILTPFPQYNSRLSVEIFSPNIKQVQPSPPPVISDSVIDVGITDSADIRKIVWRGALDIIRNYPLFGTGPETFAFAYYKYRPTEHNLTSEWDFLYNRAHNEFLNIAANSGITGLVSYLFFSLVVLLWLLRQAKTYPQDRNLLLSLVAITIAIHITNFFGFSVTYVGVWFFLLPAIAWVLVTHKDHYLPPSPIKLFNNKRLIQGASVVILFTSGYLLVTIARFWIADSLYARAMSFSRQELYAQSYPAIVSAVDLRPDEPVYHNEKGEVAANLIPLALETEDATRAAQLTRIALDSSSKAISISPQNVNFWKTRTRILYILSAYQPEFSEEALKTILVAQELAPTDPKIAYNVAVLYGRVNKNDEAITTLKKTIELKPDYRDAYIALAIFYTDQKNIQEAKNILELGLKRIDPNDTELKERLTALE